MFGLLALATLACSAGGTDVQATVNAVDTAVQLTLAALTPTPGAGTVIASATPQPTLGIAATGTASASTATAAPATVPPAYTPPTALPTPPPASTVSAQPSRPNGPAIHAVRLSGPPTIDAQGNDWPATLPNTIDQLVFKANGFNGPFDQNGHFAMGWDANNLYLYVVVIDDIHVQTQHGENLFKGDSLELQFDADLAGDFAATTLSSDDFQLGLSPGENRDAPEAFLWNPAGRAGVPVGIVMASRAGSDAGGYVFEAAIPWSFFAVTPTAGQHFGLALNSSDDDAPGKAIQQSMVSSVSTRKLLDPTSWGTMQLDP